MKKLSKKTALAVLAVATVLFTLSGVGVASASPVTLVSGTKPTGTNGDPVDAHGGEITKSGSFYYWVGQNTNADNTLRAVSIYRSSDLKTWEWRGDGLTQASSPDLVGATVERPKIIYNPATGKFVMWMHWETGGNYNAGRVAVATSSTIDGKYAYQGSFRPLGNDSRDFTVYLDTDGSAYLISVTNGNADLAIYRLNASFTNVESKVVTLWPGQHREAPALFKRNGVYFLLTSGQSGWSPNQGKYATSTSIASGWSGLQNLGDNTTFHSQPAWVLQLGSSFLYMGDRWAGANGGPVNDSTYVWYPLSFGSNTSVTLVNASSVVVDAAAGTVTKAS